MYPARAMARRDIELLRPGLLEAVRDIEAMGLWECLRRAREPLEAATLAAETSRSLSAVHAALDLLARAGLVRTKKARGRRRAVAYTVAVRELSIVIDANDPEECRIVNDVATYINRELSEALFQARRPIGTTGPNTWNFHHCSPMVLDESDLEELKRRIARVEEFMNALRDRRGSDGGLELVRCNHAVSIRIAPLGGHVLPQPAIEITTRTAPDVRRHAERAPRTPLSARERSVAIGLRSSASRAEVAKRLGLSVYTVGTLCKRIFRKLGIRRVAELNHTTL